MSNLVYQNPNTKPSPDIFEGRRQRVDERSSEATSGLNNEGEAVIPEVANSPRIDATDVDDPNDYDDSPDPAPSVPAIAEERAHQLVTNISSQMLGELRSLREQIDALMHDMNERREMIQEAIRAHAEFAEISIQHKIIISDSVAKLRADFEVSRTPLPPTREV